MGMQWDAACRWLTAARGTEGALDTASPPPPLSYYYYYCSPVIIIVFIYIHIHMSLFVSNRYLLSFFKLQYFTSLYFFKIIFSLGGGLEYDYSRYSSLNAPCNYPLNPLPMLSHSIIERICKESLSFPPYP